jgi:CheY-like chemotaxis protein
MPSGGKITIETTNAVLDDTYAQEHPGVRPGPYVMMSVTDTGCGMDAETQARIFEPFFTTKEHGKGTGLGLATVYGIVKQSGGNIFVYSEVGRGTTFRIYLPRAVGRAAAIADNPQVVEARPGSETVLLVEDDEAVRSLAREILEEAGYTVLTASDGPSAVAVSETHAEPIELLLTDLVMPQMGGAELAQRLETSRPDMSVIYVSGHTDSAVFHQGLLRPGSYFIQKPFTPTTLAAKVREVLDRRVPSRQASGSSE